MEGLTNLLNTVIHLYPSLNIEVAPVARRTARTTSYSYRIKVEGQALGAEPVTVEEDTETLAVLALKPAIAKARRAVAIEALFRELQAEYDAYERQQMREKLTNAYGLSGFLVLAEQFRQLDKDRYNAQMGHAYEQQGYYDHEEAA